MRRFVRDNGLSLVFGGLFLLSLLGQAISGKADFNHRQLGDGGSPVSMADYVLSSNFAVDVAENWQSEYLQFFLFVYLTIWLVQRGSPESKSPQETGRESDEKQLLGSYTNDRSPKWAKAGGWRTWVFSNSLAIMMGGLFLLSWSAQAVAGWSTFNNEQLVDLRDPVAFGTYVTSADYWNRSLQNWQSEFLAIGSMAVFSIYLRQRGSPESKPVGAPHGVTEQSG